MDSYNELSSVHCDDDGFVRVTSSIKIDGDATWMEVCDYFVPYLQGLGFAVTPEEVVRYLHNSYMYKEDEI